MLKVNEKCNCLKVNCYLLGIFGYKVGDLQLSETIFIVHSQKKARTKIKNKQKTITFLVVYIIFPDIYKS